VTQPTHSTEQYWKPQVRKSDGSEAEYWKSLFLRVCGYISTRPEWSGKHPEEVAQFFQAEANR